MGCAQKPGGNGSAYGEADVTALGKDLIVGDRGKPPLNAAAARGTGGAGGIGAIGGFTSERDRQKSSVLRAKRRVENSERHELKEFVKGRSSAINAPTVRKLTGLRLAIKPGIGEEGSGDEGSGKCPSQGRCEPGPARPRARAESNDSGPRSATQSPRQRTGTGKARGHRQKAAPRRRGIRSPQGTHAPAPTADAASGGRRQCRLDVVRRFGGCDGSDHPRPGRRGVAPESQVPPKSGAPKSGAPKAATPKSAARESSSTDAPPRRSPATQPAAGSEVRRTKPGCAEAGRRVRATNPFASSQGMGIPRPPRSAQ
ncbi:hypothetical protein FQA39_LY19413 [Lamprigera yunnana]|nr:hypothetical protein FQA39_LY19413 [Lamprigera yunnana]